MRLCYKHDGSQLSWLAHSLSRDLPTVDLFGFAGELGSVGPPSTHGEEADECTDPLRDLCFESSGLQPGAWRSLCSTGCVGRATGLHGLPLRAPRVQYR